MARIRKLPSTLESICFATPEQKVLRLLLSEPTTTFTSRVISSKLKGVRGLGGAEGIMKILHDLESLHLVDFLDNKRGVRLRDDSTVINLLKTFSAICELESLKKLMEPISTRGVLFGSRSNGRARSDSDYDLFVVSDQPDQIKEIAAGHPLGKNLEVIVWTPENFSKMERSDPSFFKKLEIGQLLWSRAW